MPFPPNFLDELRSRIGLASLVSQWVKLVQKGHERVGLCPFHTEKTPSFTVSEEKGFYHCFGCGAHGDIIGFLMRIENLSFPEAVEKIADEAGVPVPTMSKEERGRAVQHASLLQVMEEACKFFQSNLRSTQGQSALNYLRGRGLDEEIINKFRLGYALDSRNALKNALKSDKISLVQLSECGLLIKPDNGNNEFDRFRGRVMFPIMDRRGRVIAFGARTLSNIQPKYLNSPETPLFQKGQILYGLATAWRFAQEEKRLIIVEGYMDVIALVRAGMKAVVAPLGTALTESQISLLWRVVQEPILCFDGDNAGKLAAARVAERALPLLKPGYSLRFVTMPKGEDPDTLIRTQGSGALKNLIESARPMDRLIWDMEFAVTRLDTPERIAGLEQRLERLSFKILNSKVQYQYLKSFRWRIQEETRGRLKRVKNHPKPVIRTVANPTPPEALRKRREQTVLATLINHWTLMDEFSEILGSSAFLDPVLDKLRQEILMLYTVSPKLDSASVKTCLVEGGFGDCLKLVLGPDALIHAGFAGAGVEPSVARAGVVEVLDGLQEQVWRTELLDAEQAYTSDPTPNNWLRLRECMDIAHKENQIGLVGLDDNGVVRYDIKESI